MVTKNVKTRVQWIIKGDEKTEFDGWGLPKKMAEELAHRHRIDGYLARVVKGRTNGIEQLYNVKRSYNTAKFYGRTARKN